MKIRKFRFSDAVELARLHRTTIREVAKKDYSPKQIAAWVSKVSAKAFRDSAKIRTRFVAVEGKKIVGFGDFSKEGELTGLYVHKDYVGTNVGSKLLKQLEKTAYKKGIREFKLESTTNARKFYEKHGYKVMSKAIHRIKDQKLPVYKMKKRLRR